MQVVDFERVDGVLRHLSAALSARWIYGTDHRRASESCREFLQALQTHLAREKESDRFALGIRSGRLTYDGLFAGESSGLIRFASELQHRGFVGIAFSGEVTGKSLSALLDWVLLGEEAPESATFTGVELALGDGDPAEEDEGAVEDPFEPFRLPQLVYGSVHGLLDRLMTGASRGEIDFGDVLAVSRWSAEEAFKRGPLILSPLQILRNDPYTYRHSVNVFLIAAAMLQPIAKDPEELSRWIRAALLHDVGKCRVPKSLLHKKGQLSEEEMGVIRRHPEFGVQILLECGELDPLVLEAAYCHHMRDEGHGYPDSRPPIRPGPITRVIQIADMFEAIVSERPYKRARPVSEAIRTIRETPGLDSAIEAIELLEKTIAETPAGAEVELTTGERGLVIGADPVEILVCWDKDGSALAEPLRMVVDDSAIATVGLHADKPAALHAPEGATW